ncbi:MAG TPA: thiolase family protein [Acidimicrobiales bacterium]
MARNPIKDQVAIVGVGTTGFTRTSDRSSLALALDASTKAIRDAGLTAKDINGVVSIAEPGAPGPDKLATSLGLTDVTHFTRPTPVVMNAIVDAMNAIYAGSCDTVLVCSSMLRLPWNSRSAANDPFRRNLGSLPPSMPETIRMAPAYTAWASRYLYEHGATKEPFGRLAVNMRTNATQNPLAAMRTPITLEDYFAARMIREPLCMLDMDVPVDGADAFVLTTAERARQLTHPPVLIHAATVGLGTSDEDQLPSLSRHGQHVVVETLRAKSDIWLDDVDVYLPYDGFTIITIGWIENTGWCKPGEAGRFIAEHWDDATNRIVIDGRIPVNPHGGSLSEGATRGTGHMREAVVQLRGDAGERQVPGARTALVTPGGFFFNPQGAILRRA